MKLRQLPTRLDDSTIPGVLAAIGLPMPAGSQLYHAAGTPLHLSGYRRTEAQIDEALGKTELSTQDRLALKIALSQRRLLGQ